MKRILFGLCIAVFLSGPAWASCTNQTIMLPDGRMMFCQTCCYAGNCNTICT